MDEEEEEKEEVEEEGGEGEPRGSGGSGGKGAPSDDGMSHISDQSVRSVRSQASRLQPGEQTYVVSWGAGPNGQLGTGDKNVVTGPVLVQNLTLKRIVSIAVGKAHAAAVSDSGTLYMWGRNHMGQLGFPKGQAELRSPTIVKALEATQIRMAACGDAHTLALTNGGHVYSWGCGENGQLGHYSKESLSQPTLIEKLKKKPNVTTYIAAGGNTSAAVVNGVLCTWGLNDFGQLGHHDSTSRDSPTPVHSFNQRIHHIAQVSVGIGFMAVLLEDGKLFTCGNNYHGQLGYSGTLAQNQFHEVKQLSDVGSQCLQVSCGYTHMVATVRLANRHNHRVAYIWGTIRQASVQPGLSQLDNISYVAASQSHTLLLYHPNGRKNGRLWGGGTNNLGQLGTGDNQSPPLFAKCLLSTKCKVLQVGCGLCFSVVLCRGVPPEHLATGVAHEFRYPIPADLDAATDDPDPVPQPRQRPSGRGPQSPGAASAGMPTDLGDEGEDSYDDRRRVPRHSAPHPVSPPHPRQGSVVSSGSSDGFRLEHKEEFGEHPQLYISDYPHHHPLPLPPHMVPPQAHHLPPHLHPHQPRPSYPPYYYPHPVAASHSPPHHYPYPPPPPGSPDGGVWRVPDPSSYGMYPGGVPSSGGGGHLLHYGAGPGSRSASPLMMDPRMYDSRMVGGSGSGGAASPFQPTMVLTAAGGGVPAAAGGGGGGGGMSPSMGYRGIPQGGRGGGGGGGGGGGARSASPDMYAMRPASPASDGQPQPQLPPPWIREYDAKSGAYYYVNTLTRQSQWHPPALPLPLPASPPHPMHSGSPSPSSPPQRGGVGVGVGPASPGVGVGGGGGGGGGGGAMGSPGPGPGPGSGPGPGRGPSPYGGRAASPSSYRPPVMTPVPSQLGGDHFQGGAAFPMSSSSSSSAGGGGMRSR